MGEEVVASESVISGSGVACHIPDPDADEDDPRPICFHANSDRASWDTVDRDELPDRVRLCTDCKLLATKDGEGPVNWRSAKARLAKMNAGDLGGGDVVEMVANRTRSHDEHIQANQRREA